MRAHGMEAHEAMEKVSFLGIKFIHTQKWRRFYVVRLVYLCTSARETKNKSSNSNSSRNATFRLTKLKPICLAAKRHLHIAWMMVFIAIVRCIVEIIILPFRLNHLPFRVGHARARATRCVTLLYLVGLNADYVILVMFGWAAFGRFFHSALFQSNVYVCGNWE